MFTLLSNRMKNEKNEPEVYIYDQLPASFRTQVFYIIEDVLENYCKYDSMDFWLEIHDSFSREKGLKRLGSHYNVDWSEPAKHNIEEYLDNSSVEDVLDFIDYVFCVFDNGLRKLHLDYGFDVPKDDIINKAIAELNFRFKQHGLGYEFIGGEIVRIDNTIIHKQIVKPALKLLFDNDFEGAEEEIRHAFKYRRKSDNKNAILEAGKAFESTLKTICDKKGYAYNKDKDTAKKLIGILENNNFYPTYMSAHINSLRTTLETGVPVVRNKNSGHGQGNKVLNVSDEFAEYALNLTATNIVLLVKIYENMK